LAAAINDYVNKAPNSSSVDGKSLADRSKNSPASGNGAQEQTKILDDNSRLNTMYDGFGNKTEARCFNNHPRLTCIVLTSALNGQRKVHVYGQNGDIKELPENLLDKVTTASAEELANMAGIYATRQGSMQNEYAQTTPVLTLPAPPRPAEENQSSIRNLPTESVESKNADNPKPTSIVSETKPAAVEDTQSKENEKSSDSNRPTKEKK
jgi:hypothetical protein